MRSSLWLVGSLSLVLAADATAGQDTPFSLSNVTARSDAPPAVTIFVSTNGTPPDQSLLERREAWLLNIVTGGVSREITLHVRPSWSPTTAVVTLTIDESDLNGATLADAGWRVAYLNGSNLSVSTPAPSTPGFKAAKSKEDAAVYLLGSVLVGPSTSPIYVIDLKLDGAQEFAPGWTAAGTVEFTTNTETVAPVEKSSIDPDAMKLAGSFRRRKNVQGRYLDGYELTLAPVGLEMSRKLHTAAYVAATSVEINFNPVGAFTYYPRFGFEAGHALWRPTVISKEPVDVSAWNGISRVTAGGVIEYTFFKPKPTDTDWYHLTFSATYDARFLLQPEPFVELQLVEGVRKPVTTVEKGTRHLAAATLDWNVSQFTAVTFKYSYGSKPPLFKLVDHQLVVGVTLKAARK